MAEMTTAAKAPTLVFILRGVEAAEEEEAGSEEEALLVLLLAEFVGDGGEELVTVTPKLVEVLEGRVVGTLGVVLVLRPVVPVPVPVELPEVVSVAVFSATLKEPLLAKTLFTFPTSTRLMVYPSRAGTTGNVSVNSPSSGMTLFAMAKESWKTSLMR